MFENTLFQNLVGDHRPDILDCLNNLSNDEVFTPPSVAVQVLDLLPPEVWTDKDLRFLDPACKTGVFLREAAKRLMTGLAETIPDETERRRHVFGKMLYGLAITELTGLIARRSLYYSKDAASPFSVVKMGGVQGNIHHSRGRHVYVKGKCRFCGAPEGALDRGEGLENYAYQFIHKDLKDILDMKFDVIIGNPPYQLQDAGESTGASPIYQLFVEQAKKLEPRYISMIIPARWYAGGKGLDAFRDAMLGDKQIRKIVDFTSSSEIFPGVDIAAGVCYFLWSRGTTGDCEVTNHLAGQTYASSRPLDEYSTFVRYGFATPILHKVTAKNFSSLAKGVVSSKPFGLRTYEKPDEEGDLTLFWSGGTGPVSAERVTAGLDMIGKWKTITSRTTFDHGGQPDKNGQRRVLSRIEVLPPGTVCTETYQVVGCFESEEQANNLVSYLKTKFVRFLIAMLALDSGITKERFAFVPSLPMTEKWSDSMLYKAYNLSEDDVSFIEKLIKEMP